jgi:23S rRNA (adenine2503-C2)-methyltransferase
MNGDSLKDIRDLTLPEIQAFFKENGESAFRAKQVYDWLWVKACRSFDEMTNLSKETRTKLQQHFTFHALQVGKELRSKDGTTKLLFRLYDGLQVEGVLIPTDGRTTACISCQVGCSLGCKFCATGQLGLKRNLSAHEIFDQVAILNEQSKKYYNAPLTNIVYMGMGEPFLNYENLLSSVERITSPEGLAFSPQRITVSSVGIPKMIRKMADDNVKFHFALSLHAARNEKRDLIIPFNKTAPVEELINALRYYHQKSGKRITIEYILFKEFNDSIQDAADLASFCRNFPVKINLIEYNTVENTGFRPPEAAKVKAFHDFLETKNIVVNIRKSRGKEIDAACGQLALKQKD